MSTTNYFYGGDDPLQAYFLSYSYPCLRCKIYLTIIKNAFYFLNITMSSNHIYSIFSMNHRRAGRPNFRFEILAKHIINRCIATVTSSLLLLLFFILYSWFMAILGLFYYILLVYHLLIYYYLYLFKILSVAKYLLIRIVY